MSRCEFVNPGHPSVNRPGEYVVAPWRCVHEEGHDSPHAPVPVCPRVALHKQGYAWRCVLAEGHEGACLPPVEAAHLSRPLREMDREELIRAAVLAFGRSDDAWREARRIVASLDRWQAQVMLIMSAALETKSPHGNNHTDDCWRRHPHCLAFAIIGSGGPERTIELIREAKR